MEDSSDSEYEIEEAVVLVELNGIIDSNFLLQEDINCKVLGIDCENPILQLGQYTFAGEYEDTVGTVVAYELDESQQGEEKKYKFTAKTDKKLVMKRVFVQEKIEESLQKSALTNTCKVSAEKEFPLKEIKENSIDNIEKGKLNGATKTIPKSKRKIEADPSKSVATELHKKTEPSPQVECVEPRNACIYDAVNELIEKTVVNSESSDRKQTSQDEKKAKGTKRGHDEADDSDSKTITKKKLNQSDVADVTFPENVALSKSLHLSSDAVTSQDMEIDINKHKPDIKKDSLSSKAVTLKLSPQQESEVTKESCTELKNEKNTQKIKDVQKQASFLEKDSSQFLEESAANENIVLGGNANIKDSTINSDLEIQSTGEESLLSGNSNQDTEMFDLLKSSMEPIENDSVTQSSEQSDVIEIQIVVEEGDENLAISVSNEERNDTVLISNERHRQGQGQSIITLSFSDQGVTSSQNNESHSISVISETLNEVLNAVTDPSPDVNNQNCNQDNASESMLEKIETGEDQGLTSEINIENKFFENSARNHDEQTITSQLSFDSSNALAPTTEENVTSLKEPEISDICRSPDCSNTPAFDALELDNENNLDVQSEKKALTGNQKVMSFTSWEENSQSLQMPTLTAGASDEEKEFPSFEHSENLLSNQMPTISLGATNAATTAVQSCAEGVQNVQMLSRPFETLGEKIDITQSEKESFPSNVPLEELNKNSTSTQAAEVSLPLDTSSSKDIPCEVSQSSRNNPDILLAAVVLNTSNEGDEGQILDCSGLVGIELQSDGSENVHVREIYDDDYAEENTDKYHSRKLSSCEVTQSCNSKAESQHEENTNECDVFVQNSLPGFESFADASSSKRDALVSADEGLKESEVVRHSITSEGSTSEISQSHRDESPTNEEILEQAEYTYNIEHCSQSTSSVLVTHPMDSKSLCVSSCSTDQNVESILLDAEAKNLCEVSQSDRSESHSNSKFETNLPDDPSELKDNSMSERYEMSSSNFSNQENYCEVTESYEVKEQIHSESSNLLAENDSSECEPLMVSVDRSESINVLSNDREPCASSDHVNPISASDIVVENSTSCEVTQSSSTENILIENTELELDNALHSNECEVYEEVDCISDDSNLASAADNQSLGSSVILLNQEEEECINPSCEVSQSFKPLKENNVPLDDCCVSSDEANELSTPNHTLAAEKITDEVSQSVSLTIPILSDMPSYKLSECDQPNLVSHSDELYSNDQNESAESSKEVCSSDEINTGSGNLENINNSACEVTQSDRPEEGILLPQSQDFLENESLNECEAFGKSSSSLEDLRGGSIDCGCEAKNICESSDDIELASSESLVATQKQIENDSGVSQSSGYGSKASDLPEMGNEYDNETEMETENNDIHPSNLCESSETVRLVHTADPCTSSNKVGNEKTSDVASNDRLCDSISNPDASVYIGTATGSVSQSGRDLNNTLITSSVASSVPLYNTVTVSSSVDISSNALGIVYSSQITHFLPEQELIHVSNSEVSQSSMLLNQEPASKSEDSNEVENNLCAEIPLPHPSVIVSSDANISSNTLENIESYNEPVSDSNIIPTSAPDRSRSDFVESSCSRVESSSPDIMSEIDNRNISSPSKNEKETIVVKKFGRKLKFTPKVTSKAKQEREEHSTSKAKETDSSVAKSDQQSTIDNTSESSSVDASANVIKSNSDSRPSLLEVIVSSASDFRNSLIHDNSNFDRETSPSETAESSSNTDTLNESADLFDPEAGHIREGQASAQFYESGDNDLLVTESMSYNEEKNNNNSQQRVSQSSEIINIYSSVIVSGLSENENVSESSQHQLVQSTSGVIKKSSQLIEDANSNVLSASTPKTCGTSEVSDSSHATFALSSASNDNIVTLDDSGAPIESSDNVNMCTDNTDTNVSSTPLETNDSKLLIYSADGSDQCCMIEGTDDISFSSELVQSRLNIYSSDGSGQCDLIECTDEAQTLFDNDSNLRIHSADRSDQCTLTESTNESHSNTGGDICGVSSEFSESVKEKTNPDSKVSASHDPNRPASKIWRSRFQEENCASSSMDENSTTINSSRTQLLIIEPEASNEAEVLKSGFIGNSDSENFFLVSESGQIVINQSMPENIDSPSDYNVDNNYKQDISQSSCADQTLQPELYSENNEVTLFPLRSGVSIANQTCSSQLAREMESSGNSVVPSELSQNILLASSDSSIYSQSVDFNNGSIDSSSLEVLQYPTDEQIVAPSLSSTICDRIETLTDTVALQSFSGDERSNVSQSYIHETVQVSEESNQECDAEVSVASPDSHCSEYVLQEEDDCDNSC